MGWEFSVKTPTGKLLLTLEAGLPIIFVGANGSGKTLLAQSVEYELGSKAHRISAHRALTLNPGVAKISHELAINGLRNGLAHQNSSINDRYEKRWRQQGATALLDDFDFLIQVLFAEQINQAIKTHQSVREGDHSLPAFTKFEMLQDIWDRLLPKRKLYISGDDIRVESPERPDEPYSASGMSDGERAIFYLIGQALVAAKDSVLIVDEPELHIHRSILSKLWDELEAAREDCGFIFITHDLDFSASRASKKYVIHKFLPLNEVCWDIKLVPENSGFDEAIATLILGSRRPILFVEGDENSLDIAVYRCCYPGWTIIPRGSCEAVINSVIALKNNNEFTRIACVGIIDADGRENITYLAERGVYVLSVMEIENVFLLPEVSRVIAMLEDYSGSELESKLNNLKNEIFLQLNSPAKIDEVVARQCRRQIDRALKKIDLSAARTVADVALEYKNRTMALDVEKIGVQVKSKIEEALQNRDLNLLLKNYENKGLLAIAAKVLKNTREEEFRKWLSRKLHGNNQFLVKAIQEILPKIN